VNTRRIHQSREDERDERAFVSSHVRVVFSQGVVTDTQIVPLQLYEYLTEKVSE